MNAESSSVPFRTRTNQSERGDFLARVRRSLGRDAPPVTPPDLIPVDDDLFRLARVTGDVSSLFVRRASAAGMSVRRCNEQSLAKELAALITTHSLKRIVARIADEDLARSLVALPVLAQQCTILTQQTASIDSCFDADAGITDASAAIAESGSLLISSDVHDRAAFIVPPHHIALVRTSVIIPDLLDLWRPGTDAPPMPASLVLVSGPSKTADIEGVLVTGVHGPREVHVLIVDPV